jgi:hypothetical protein
MRTNHMKNIIILNENELFSITGGTPSVYFPSVGAALQLAKSEYGSLRDYVADFSNIVGKPSTLGDAVNFIQTSAALTP